MNTNTAAPKDYLKDLVEAMLDEACMDRYAQIVGTDRLDALVKEGFKGAKETKAALDACLSLPEDCDQKTHDAALALARNAATILGFVPAESAEDQMDAVGKLLGIEAEDTGGGVMCFCLRGSESDKAKNLIFGYGGGPLGWSTEDGEKYDEMPKSGDHSAEAQVRYIRETCQRLGYKIKQ